jgi:hypothetical protein
MMNSREAVSRRLVDPAFLLRLIRLQQVANLVFAGAFLAVVGLWAWQRTHPQQYIPIATSRDGRPVVLTPLDRPNMSNASVLQWTAATIRKAYAINWRNYASHLDEISDHFTTRAWNQFGSSLKNSGNLAKIKAARMVGWVQPNGAARIINRGVIGPYYTWLIIDPITVHYENQNEQITDPLTVKIYVRRAAFGHDGAGVVIEQINAVPQ